MIKLQQATFLLGAAKLEQLPDDIGYEVAFAGRSNAGKSSALNVVTNQKKLARTSKTPGRTQEINVFEITDTQRLIDLPGYGFAKVSVQQQKNWEATLTKYLETRQALKGLILLVDSRLPIKATDMILLHWCVDSKLPCHVVLTKADKLNQSEKAASLKATQTQFYDIPLLSVQLFSASKKIGLEELQQRIISWLEPNNA